MTELPWPAERNPPSIRRGTMDDARARPSPNATAIRHLLGRGFRIDPWIACLMSNRPFGQFDRYLNFSPPLFL